jgi:hypothetical protein
VRLGKGDLKQLCGHPRIRQRADNDEAVVPQVQPAALHIHHHAWRAGPGGGGGGLRIVQRLLPATQRNAGLQTVDSLAGKRLVRLVPDQ